MKSKLGSQRFLNVPADERNQNSDSKTGLLEKGHPLTNYHMTLISTLGSKPALRDEKPKITICNRRNIQLSVPLTWIVYVVL